MLIVHIIIKVRGSTYHKLTSVATYKHKDKIKWLKIQKIYLLIRYVTDNFPIFSWTTCLTIKIIFFIKDRRRFCSITRYTLNSAGNRKLCMWSTIKIIRRKRCTQILYFITSDNGRIWVQQTSDFQSNAKLRILKTDLRHFGNN